MTVDSDVVTQDSWKVSELSKSGGVRMVVSYRRSENVGDLSKVPQSV
jgi:hypothetical protein